MPSGTGLPIQGSYSWLRLTKESTYGVYDPAGDFIWVVLTGDDPFTAALTMMRTVIRSADTSNRRRNNIATKYTLAGGFKTPFYPSQAKFLLDCASTLSSTVPHTLPSLTADFFDGQTPRRWTGGMCENCTIGATAEEQYANLDMQWRFRQTDDTALTIANFPPPGCAELPEEDPYLFNELDGTFTFGLTGQTVAPVTIFDQFNLSIANILDSKHYEKPYVAYTMFAGRDVNLMTNLAYVDTTWREFYEKQEQLTLEATFNRSATQKATLNLWTNNYVGERPVSHPLAGVVTQGITAEAFYDCTATPDPTDFSFTALYS